MSYWSQPQRNVPNHASSTTSPATRSNIASLQDLASVPGSGWSNQQAVASSRAHTFQNRRREPQSQVAFASVSLLPGPGAKASETWLHPFLPPIQTLPAASTGGLMRLGAVTDSAMHRPLPDTRRNTRALPLGNALYAIDKPPTHFWLGLHQSMPVARPNQPSGRCARVQKSPVKSSQGQISSSFVSNLDPRSDPAISRLRPPARPPARLPVCCEAPPSCHIPRPNRQMLSPSPRSELSKAPRP
ncbi:hypothetical protein BKA81DRAFT_376221 [Phyllosticta paracitricarpa]|uniref:Uncharacterized protein n=1 Tax=Phyllosticta citricarpa TaxID=55181 RepID=A0ABR1MG98_9PEZI